MRSFIPGLLAVAVLAACSSSSDDDAGSGASVPAAEAKQYCGKLMAAGCVVGSEAQCEQSISIPQAEAKAAGCTQQFETLFTCRNTGTVTCDAQGNLQSPTCDTQTQALNTCIQD